MCNSWTLVADVVKNIIQFSLVKEKGRIAYWPFGHKENLQEHAMVALIFQLKYKYNV